MTGTWESTIVVVGDVIVDTVCAVGDLHLPEDGHLQFESMISTTIGGAGYSLCLGVSAAGAVPVLLAPVDWSGAQHDPGTQLATSELDAIGVRLRSTLIGGMVGRAILLYGDNGQRILVGDRGKPSNPEVFRAALDKALREGTEGVVCSGYAYFAVSEPEIASAVLDGCRLRQVPLGVDVVPHALWRRLPREKFLELIDGVSSLSVEASTLGRWGLSTDDLDPAIPTSVRSLMIFRDGHRWSQHDRRGGMTSGLLPHGSLRPDSAKRGQGDQFFARSFTDDCRTR